MLRGSVYCDIYHSVVQYYVVANFLTVMGGAILLQKWPGVVGSPTFAVNLCVCYNGDDIVY